MDMADAGDDAFDDELNDTAIASKVLIAWNEPDGCNAS